MTITLNGKVHQIAESESLSVKELLKSLPLGEQPVLVELNGQALLMREFPERIVKDGDEVEVIKMVAGG